MAAFLRRDLGDVAFRARPLALTASHRLYNNKLTRSERRRCIVPAIHNTLGVAPLSSPCSVLCSLPLAHTGFCLLTASTAYQTNNSQVSLAALHRACNSQHTRGGAPLSSPLFCFTLAVLAFVYSSIHRFRRHCGGGDQGAAAAAAAAAGARRLNPKRRFGYETRTSPLNSCVFNHQHPSMLHRLVIFLQTDRNTRRTAIRLACQSDTAAEQERRRVRHINGSD